MFRFVFGGDNSGIDGRGAKSSCCRAQDVGMFKSYLLLQVRSDQGQLLNTNKTDLGAI